MGVGAGTHGPSAHGQGPACQHVCREQVETALGSPCFLLVLISGSARDRPCEIAAAASGDGGVAWLALPDAAVTCSSAGARGALWRARAALASAPAISWPPGMGRRPPSRVCPIGPSCDSSCAHGQRQHGRGKFCSTPGTVLRADSMQIRWAITAGKPLPSSRPPALPPFVGWLASHPVQVAGRSVPPSSHQNYGWRLFCPSPCPDRSHPARAACCQRPGLISMTETFGSRSVQEISERRRPCCGQSHLAARTFGAADAESVCE